MKEKAFPFGDFEGCLDIGQDKSRGMNLRDYFDARAMATLLEIHSIDRSGNTFVKYKLSNRTDNTNEVIEYISKMSYQIADGMIKERE